MKILIFGRGQLGQAYHEYYQEKGDDVRIAEGVDIRQFDQVSGAIAEFEPDVVFNCAGKTNLDWCEQNQLECFDVNTLGSDCIGRACQEAGVYLVHLSSGCVQESLTEDIVHTEDHPPHPLAFYSWTKVWAENLLMERAERQGLKVLLLRGRQLMSAKANKRNALTKMLTYNKFIDTANSMTIVEDLIEATDKLVELRAEGLYNITNPGVMTPLRLAELLKELVKPDMEFIKITKDELNAMTLATRVDCVLDTSKLNALGIELEEIESRLRRLLPVFKANLERAEEILAETQQETDYKLSLVK